MAYKIVDAETLDAGLTTVADAIRDRANAHLLEAEVTEALAFPDGMAEAVSAIPDPLGGYAMDTLAEYRNDDITITQWYWLAYSASLKKVSLPNVGTCRHYSFWNCSQLAEADLPATTVFGRDCFKSTAIKTIDLPSATQFHAGCFQSAPLEVLVLRGGTVPEATSSSFLAYTPIADGLGIILVPASMVGSYQGATNWSTYSAQFRAVEEYTLDGTITGDLDWDKINAELEALSA